MYNCTIVHVHVRRTMTKMMILFVDQVRTVNGGDAKNPISPLHLAPTRIHP